MDKHDFIWIAGDGTEKALRRQARDQEGRPLSSAKIDVFRAVKGELVATTQTDEDGNYALELPTGTYLVRIIESKQYHVDAAVAKPVSADMVDSNIIGIGKIRGLGSPEVGMKVQKSGRSTGLTRGQITTLGATVNVGFGMGRSARFTNQIITTSMGEPGDSGSLLLDNTNQAIGLLFAGSPKATIFHPVTEVMMALNVRLDAQDRYAWPEEAETFRSLKKVCTAAADSMLKLPNVVGVGLGHKIVSGVDTQTPCLTVLVAKKVPLASLRSEELIPSHYNHLPTDVVESGAFRADTDMRWFGTPQNRKVKLRPAKPGMSMGHYQVSAGTFGAVVYERNTGEKLILSNNHVLANATNGKDNQAKVGDPILQPGRQDGGVEPDDVIATLYRFSFLNFN